MKMQELIYKLSFDNFINAKDFLYIDDSLKNNERLIDDKL